MVPGPPWLQSSHSFTTVVIGIGGGARVGRGTSMQPQCWYVYALVMVVTPPGQVLQMSKCVACGRLVLGYGFER
jgi:hypothetical protein